MKTKLLLFLPFILAINCYSQTAENYYDKAFFRNSNQDYNGAIEDFSKAIKLDSSYSDAYYHRGLTYNIINKYTEAIADYTKAIELNPKYAEVYVARGIAKSDLHDYDGAMKDFSKVIEINPKYSFVKIFYSPYGRNEESRSTTSIDSLGNITEVETMGETNADSVIFSSEKMTWTILLKDGSKYEYVYRINKPNNIPKGKVNYSVYHPAGFYDKDNNRYVTITFESCPHNFHIIRIDYPDDYNHEGICTRKFKYR